MKPESIQKADALTLWKAQPENQQLKPGAIAYKHRGSTIDEDGIRICGTKPFILATLSRLKALLTYENTDTRLGIAFSELTDRDTGQIISGRYRCTVQVHERGDEARRMNRYIARRCPDHSTAEFQLPAV